LKIIVATGIIVAATGCGGTTGSGGSTSSGVGTKLNLEAKDFAFSPANLTAPARDVTVTLTNSGTKHHNLTIEDGVDKKVNQDVDPGRTVTLTFKLNGSGKVAFHCEYHQTFKDPSNSNAGMVGTINGSGY